MGKAAKIFSPLAMLFGGGGGGDSGQSDATRAQTEAMNAASARAAETAKQTEAARANAAKAQQDMQTNFQANLAGEGKATVVAGGTADALGVADSTKKKRLGSGGLASTLGINV